MLTEAVAAGRRVCDLGSGAGLPGLVLAIARRDLRVTLVEPMLRRTTFLRRSVDALGLDSVEVRARPGRGAARARGFRGGHVARLAPLPRLLGWSMPLVATAGACWR